jgi:probable HAF family extracellular repeat protein
VPDAIRSLRCVVMTALIAIGLTGPATAQNIWTATNLGTLGGSTSWADDVNGLGQVVGFAEFDDGQPAHAFLWTPTNGMIDLGTLGGAASGATAINNLGQVVGTSDLAPCPVPFCMPVQRAFLWRNGVMSHLGTLGGAQSFAYGINDAGQVVGSSETAGGVLRAFLWTQAAGMTDLGTLGGSMSQAFAINALGHVVGAAQTAGGATHAFLWTPADGMIDLGTLAGGSSSANGLNNLGHVVGSSDGQAFLWTQGTGMIAPIGTLGGADSIPYDINDAGQVAGRSLTASDDRHAFVWTAGGGIVDLGALGGIVSFGYAINEAGQVAGRAAADGDGPLTATLWTPAGTNRPPDCSLVAPSQTALWPPDHRLMTVTLGGAIDPDGDAASITITGVTQDEPVDGIGDGNTTPDAGFTFASAGDAVQLRAERRGDGDGRIYRIAFTVDDGKGGACSAIVPVGVPHSTGVAAVDSGGAYNSFGRF